MSTYTPINTAENLQVDGALGRFTYRRFGPRGGIPLVLVHRFRATVDWWDPEFLDILAADRDVIVFDNIGIGYTGGEALITVEGFGAGAVDFIDALGLSEVDLLGWSFGGVVAQAITLTRPSLVRKLIVAGSGSGLAPNMPSITERVLQIMAKPNADLEDTLYLFYPETEEARKLGLEHFDKVSAAMPPGAPVVSEEAAMGQLQAITAALATPWEQVVENLKTITQPVLYANGMHDVMIHAFASYSAVEHLPSAKLALYSDAGHAFLFQHLEEFTTEVKRFLAD
ncbi:MULTISPECIES: alpha/beta fold hydrolase [Rhodococcus]|uniref:Hydrolase n=2 Tax=Rhodococcus TaxID=1827 RepID=A0A076EI47_RHOOP|nr:MULTISPECIES: alpha/beta hydrolase [Rhodococcus]AII03209.1 hydrolase [Rhodococcus opacus]GAF43106.1 putative hydrolase [Rhodococcus wratislaviensis NBRC 100605]